MCILRAVPPRQEGVRVVTNAGWDAVDADATLDERRLKRTAKSCGPGAPKQALRPRNLFADDGGNQAMVTGESTK